MLPDSIDIQPKTYEHISKAADYLGRVADYMEKQAMAVYNACVTEVFGDGAVPVAVEIAIPVLLAADALLVEMVIYKAICKVAGRKKDITSEFVRMVMNLCDKQTGKLVNLKYGVTVKRVYDKLVLKNSDGQTEVDNTKGNCNNKLYSEIVNIDEGTALGYIESIGGFPRDNLKKYFDWDKLLSKMGEEALAPGIAVRTAEPDDFIALFSDGRGKKVFDVLKDEKTEAGQRKHMPVAAVKNEVLLIKGIRGSEAYRIDDNTKNILLISFISED